MKQQQLTREKRAIQRKTTQQQEKLQPSARVSEHPYMPVQSILGNHGVLRRYGSDVIQAKLNIGSPNDKYEQEADRVAEQVMRIPELRSQRRLYDFEEEKKAIQIIQQEKGTGLKSIQCAGGDQSSERNWELELSLEFEDLPIEERKLLLEPVDYIWALNRDRRELQHYVDLLEIWYWKDDEELSYYGLERDVMDDNYWLLSKEEEILLRYGLYEYKIEEAVQRLKNVQFGRAEWGEYDWELWLKEVDPEFRFRLVLEPRPELSPIEPCTAIEDLVTNIDKWTLDCSQFVQVVELYAMCHAYYASEGFNPPEFSLREQWSTGVRTKTLWWRDNTDDDLIRDRYDQSGGVVSEVEATSDRADNRIEEILALSPVGARIGWTNMDLPEGDTMRNENTIKLGDDLFAANFGAGEKKFTRAELEEKMALAVKDFVDRDSLRAYIEENIFIARIAWYEMPWE